MTDIKIENIVAYAQIADGLDIVKLSVVSPMFKYSPDEFSGLTIKFDIPKTAVLILPSGKAICTGATNIEDVNRSIKNVIDKIQRAGLKVNCNPKIETRNVIVSSDFEKELHLSSISKGLILEHVSYEPENFPGLIYKMDELGAILILFNSGKIVSTGAKNYENASKAIETMKDKLLSIGAL
jgi:transcription initiation factor TFIID TATA-box-binding protein